MRYLDDLRPIRRYLVLKAEAARINEEMEQLKPLITAALMEEPEQTYEFGGHRFEIGRRRSYAYSDSLKQMERDLKDLKARERNDGTAYVEADKAFPVVRAIKN